jgi:two-component system nitrogen regulation response regulator GlnG/two-component system response regulator HydG
VAHIGDDETAPEVPAKTLTGGDVRLGIGFIVLHAPGDPEHVGAWISAADTGPTRDGVLGRGVPQLGDACVRLKAVRQRPSVNFPLPPLASPSLSRDQLVVRAIGEAGLELTNRGRRPLVVNGQPTGQAHARVGDVVEVGAQLVLLVASRPPVLRAGCCVVAHPFGDADVDGYVGESPAAWELRNEIAFMGPLAGHVLIAGETGTGKELVASAFHRLSNRGGPLVSRNAATFPESLVDAELFGNLKGYPNPGMPERKGLVGTAHGGSFFLDEFAELSPDAQAKLLRVLDSGEYQTLGESRSRRSDFRLIAATNRPLAKLREDLLARFDLRLRLPSLEDRLEDLPFLVRHLLREMTQSNEQLRDKVFDGGAWPKLSASFMSHLVRASFSANVRGVRAVLWRSVSKAMGDALEWPEVCQAVNPEEQPENLQARQLERVLEENDGSLEKSWRALGLSSRYALMRLLRKHRVTVVRRSARD